MPHRAMAHSASALSVSSKISFDAPYQNDIRSPTLEKLDDTASDPVALGHVAGLNRPGGNATGVFILANSLEARRLGLLHEIVPHASMIAMLLNPQGPGAQAQLAEVQDAARMLARPISILYVASEADLDAAFAQLSELRAGAVLVAADPYFNSRREQLIALAMHHAIPAIYEFREI